MRPQWPGTRVSRSGERKGRGVTTVRKRDALLRLSGMLRAGGLRRALMATVLGVVVISVVGMHQLSLGHTFATPPLAGAHQHLGAQPSTAEGHDYPGYAQHMGDGATGMPDDGVGGSSTDHCPGCGGHSVALGACLLALTLLVLSWWLAPPRICHLLLRMLWRRATVGTFLGRWVPALSLAELSVLRT